MGVTHVEVNRFRFCVTIMVFICVLVLYRTIYFEYGFGDRFSVFLASESFITVSRPNYSNTNDYSSWTAGRCTVSKCLDTLRCLINPHRRLTVALQPILHFEEGMQLSLEYLELRQLIRESVYYVEDLDLACIVIPGLDVFRNWDSSTAKSILRLTRHNDKYEAIDNLLIFNFMGQSSLKRLSDGAMSISAAFTDVEYRNGFDIAVPILRRHDIGDITHASLFRPHKLIAVEHREDMNEEQLKIAIFNDVSVSDESTSLLRRIRDLVHKNITVTILDDFNAAQLISNTNKNDLLKYRNIITGYDIIIIPDETPAFDAILMDIFQGGRAIPVMISDRFIPPFSNALDWNEFSFSYSRSYVNSNPNLFHGLSLATVRNMRAHCDRIYAKYFSSARAILDTTLTILQERLVSGTQLKSWTEWNLVQSRQNEIFNLRLPKGASRLSVQAIVFFKDKASALRLEISLTKIVNSLISNLTMRNWILTNVTIFWPENLDVQSHTPRFEGIHSTYDSINVIILYGRMSRSDQMWTLRQSKTTADCIVIINGSAMLRTKNLETDHFGNSLIVWSEQTEAIVLARQKSSATILGISLTHKANQLFDAFFDSNAADKYHKAKVVGTVNLSTNFLIS